MSNRYKLTDSGKEVFDTQTGASIPLESASEELLLELQNNPPDPAYSLAELKKKRYNEINTKTDLLIANGYYTYGGVNFSTDLINQNNFMALGLNNIIGTIIYPYSIWNGYHTIELQNSTELLNFLQGFSSAVETIRRNGKTLRDTLINMTYEELENFQDTRT